MTRRMLLVSSLAPLLRADSAQQIRDLFGAMTGSLSACNPQGFLGVFDKAMPGYQRLSINVNALANEFIIESSVDLKRDEGDDQKRRIEAEWLLTLRPHETRDCENDRQAAAIATREQVLNFTAAKQGRRWIITALEPVDFFAPPAP